MISGIFRVVSGPGRAPGAPFRAHLSDSGALPSSFGSLPLPFRLQIRHLAPKKAPFPCHRGAQITMRPLNISRKVR